MIAAARAGLAIGLVAAATVCGSALAQTKTSEARTAGRADATVVAKVGALNVTLEDLKAYLATLDEDSRARLAKDPQLLNRLVRVYVARLMVIREAEAGGWDRKPEISAQLERVRQETVASTYLRSRTEPPKGFPSDAEIAAAYETNKGQFLAPRQFEIGQIFIAAPAGEEKAEIEAAQKRAEAMAKALRLKPSAFDETARKSSEDQATAAQGGRIGWLTEAAMNPDIRTAILGLEKGGITEPIRLSDGWHILRLIDTKPATVRPLSEVRDAIVASLREQRRADAEQLYLSRMLEKNPPAINELALPQALRADSAQ